LVTFKEIIGHAKKVKKRVQESSILDPLARLAIKSIPVAGDILLEMWDKSAGSDSVKDQTLATMDLIIKMNEENFKEFTTELKGNKDEIIKNQGLLNEILFKYDELLGEVKQISTKVDKGFKNTEEKLDELHKNQMLIFEKLGIENTVASEKKIEISNEVLTQLEEKDREISRLSTELEQQNNKPEFDLDYNLKKANTYYYAKNYVKANELYDLILKEYPDDVNALYNKGLVLYDLGKLEEAIVWYDKALGIDPKHVYALNNKGAALDKLGKLEEAITWFDKALEINPKHVSALSNKGVALDKLGKHEEAITWFDKALEIDPKHVYALNNKGVVLHKMGKHEEAIVWYDKALDIDPEHVDALYNKGLALGNLGKYEEAIVWYDKALDIDPKHVDVLYNKGTALVNLGKYEEAIVWYDKALDIDPEHVDALYNKSCLYALKGNTEESLHLLEKTIVLDQSYKEIAKEDKDFLNLREDKRFKKLVNPILKDNTN